MFIAYIYIRFNQNLEKKSNISSKTATRSFSANCGRAPMSNMSCGSMLILKCKLHYVPMFYHDAFSRNTSRM